MESPPTGTVTFLFTDIEGSTRRWQDEPEAMRALLVEHDAILRDVIDKRHGHLFKHTGDGVAAVFSSAADAANAAVDAQGRLQDVLPVRMGLHTGEAELRDGDYFGSTLNRCARLMGVAHGGQIVCSAATVELVRDRGDLRDLGEHRLRDLSRAERVWQVGGGEFAALRSLENYLTNLPLQLSSFVGREREIVEVGRLLGEHRLVTLTGVGGVGKTRLAVEVGAEVLPHYPDGVWLVELAPLAHDELVLSTIAEVLGVAAQTGEPLATTLVGRLKAKQLLVILDNCEHVLGVVARIVEQVAAGAAGVRVLATSREPLGIAAERVRAVPPLAEAVELFLDRAAASGAVFDGSEQRRAVVEICARLDGIPLAIELAAARARMMAPTKILERLDQRFRLLTGGGRTAVERHRTLQATVAWSYDLLDDTEKRVFQRLSTLAGSFDLEAAEAIAAGGEVEGFEVLDALGHLVDKSMVLSVPPDGVRYRLLETLRQFAADRLAEQLDATEVQDRHGAYWCDRAGALGPGLFEAGQAGVLDAIDADIDNYRTAFAYLLATGNVNDAARGVLALGSYWYLVRNREGLAWSQQLLARSDLDADQRLLALANAGQTEAMFGDLRAGERYATEAVALAAATGVDPPWEALRALMNVAVHRNDPVAFRQRWEHAHQIVTANEPRGRQLLIEVQRGMVLGAWDSGELIGHYERLLPKVRRHGTPGLLYTWAACFATVLYQAGQFDRARELARSAIEPARPTGPTLHATALTLAASYDALAGDTDRARTAAAEGIRLARDEGLTRTVTYGVYVAAALAAQGHDPETAAVLLAAAATHADLLGIAGNPIVNACRSLAQTAVDAHPGDLTTARQRGENMTVDELCAYTLDTLT